MTSVQTLATRRGGGDSITASTADLPPAVAVTRAFTTQPREHPVLVAASGLASHHRFQAQARRLTFDPTADDHVVAAATRQVNAAVAARAVLIDQIDKWVGVRVNPGSRCEPLHTDTLGAVVDRLAEVWMRWQLVTDDPNPAAQAQAQVALHQLSELSIAYDDLVVEVSAGRRQLPVYQTPTGPAAA